MCRLGSSCAAQGGDEFCELCPQAVSRFGKHLSAAAQLLQLCIAALHHLLQLPHDGRLGLQEVRLAHRAVRAHVVRHVVQLCRCECRSPQGCLDRPLLLLQLQRKRAVTSVAASVQASVQCSNELWEAAGGLKRALTFLRRPCFSSNSCFKVRTTCRFSSSMLLYCFGWKARRSVQSCEREG